MLGDNLLFILWLFFLLLHLFVFFSLLVCYELGLLYLGAVFVLFWLGTEEIIYAVCTFFLACPLGGAWDVRPRSRSGVV